MCWGRGGGVRAGSFKAVRVGVGLLALLALQAGIRWEAGICGEAGWDMVHSGAPRDRPPCHCPLKTLGAHRFPVPQLTPSPEHKCLLGPGSDTQQSRPAGWCHYLPFRGSCPHSLNPRRRGLAGPPPLLLASALCAHSGAHHRLRRTPRSARPVRGEAEELPTLTPLASGFSCSCSPRPHLPQPTPGTSLMPRYVCPHGFSDRLS